MARTWTSHQRQAIEARGGAVIVSAAAGSGKTAVLVERAIRLITDEEKGIPADRLLVVTYTRAAAAELKQRLYQALDEKIEAEPGNRYLTRQQTLLEKAHISTIHSFCQSLVREFFVELDIDRNVRVADDSELIVVRADALRLTLDEMYAKGDERFFELVESFSSPRDDALLGENILKIFEFLRSHPFPKKWMQEQLSRFEDFSDINDSVWGAIIDGYFSDALAHLKALNAASIALMEGEEAFAGALELLKGDRTFLIELEAAKNGGSWDEIARALNGFVKGRMTVKKGFAQHPDKMKVDVNRKDFKKTVETLQGLYGESSAQCRRDIDYLQSLCRSLFEAVSRFSENFAALKKEKGIADFSDLEHWTLQLLLDEDGRKTALCRRISERFDEIMVDEFQDANETQDVLFSALSKQESNLFFVGDVKQSIYGFRQAMPQLFLRRKDDAEDFDEADPRFPAKIILEQNFRSNEAIIEAVNYYFSHLMSPSVGEIRYDETEKLYLGAQYAPSTQPEAEMALIEGGEEKDERAMAEAKWVAERVMALISSGYQVKEKTDQGESYRPITFSDVAVLMRTKTQAPVFVDVLSRLAVPATTAASRSFLDSYEIAVLVNFLRIINNPALDVPMLSVLMSPVFAFSPDDLARIRIHQRKGSLFSALKADEKRGSEKSRRFLEELSFLRNLAATVEIRQLIRAIFERVSFLSVMSATSDSPVAENNLRLFLEDAKSFEMNTKRGLSSFVFYLDRLSENKGDLASASASTSAVNAVQVMTIHASKGLEFPVVFICDSDKQFNSDTKENVLLHAKYGIALKRKDEALGAFFDTMPRQALKIEMKRSEMSEELRVLYVAMTRARQKLIFPITTKNAEKRLEKVAAKLCTENEISPFLVRSASSLGDWLIMGALLHPDADSLREVCVSDVVAHSHSDFRLLAKVVTGMAQEEEESEEEETIHRDAHIDEEVIATLEQHAAFAYPYQDVIDLERKVAASTLAHRLSQSGMGRILARPAFLQKKTLTAAERGTALHGFLQFADFQKARADVAAELKRLKDGGFLSETQADSIDIEKAHAFLSSSIVSRCLKSETVFREYRFSVEIPARKVHPEMGARFENENVILQGAVDLAFLEDGKLVIVDYKTDRVKNGDQLVRMYAPQLMLYQDALEQCLGYPVKECLIYSICLSEEIRVDNHR